MVKPDRTVIAVTGRGGAGKTTLTSIMIKLLTENAENRILAVDADPPTGLTYALGGRPLKTISEIRRKMIEEPEERKRIKSKSTRDIIFDEAITDVNGVSLLIMGRAEGQGCFCSINELLKFGIETLSREYDVTLIDCEAGIEQVHRRVISSVGTLIIVSDASVRGIQTATQLRAIVSDYDEQKPDRTVLIVNKVNADKTHLLKETAGQYGLEVAGFIPVDENVINYNMTDRPMLELPDDSASVAAVRGILKDLDIIG
jgi:CO dehydrogenase maturation factor